ncbi:MAG: four helix bundle protein [Verrucomicrobia bacterium]|nr:four helix bundle protein [Verrucomicrobiota bacterium]
MRFDLEERTFCFARDTRTFVRALPRTLANVQDARQLIRSSGSVGANYIEACEALSKKDLAMRMKICRKEAKETHYWLRLLYLDPDPALEATRQKLLREAHELTSIFGSIVSKY